MFKPSSTSLWYGKTILCCFITTPSKEIGNTCAHLLKSLHFFDGISETYIASQRENNSKMTTLLRLLYATILTIFIL